MINLFWRLADWFIARAKLTPYQHIMSADGTEMYMGRWWLFNPYSRETHKPKFWWCPWSFRIHHILRPDEDRDLHDHPWNARTIILRGWYSEQRPSSDEWKEKIVAAMVSKPDPKVVAWVLRNTCEWIMRYQGDTARLNHGEYHRIDQVSPGGVFTLFITSKWRGDWGFLVNGVKVPWRTYTGTDN
ncbi:MULTISPECIES: hypothetical protein [Pseudomonas]|uniref:hypothetical protein n=1 Tax=Pseudomonas TaxID=286 RepID=UPI001070F0E5|nr:MULTISPECIES: hypothetical protein [Pseudomonas]QBR32856.1 hypothetical protein E3Z29_21165 [Pseudomonas sp. S150]UZT91039.1 hypothetical protein OPS05_18160 [Pseudomonas koreensis]